MAHLSLSLFGPFQATLDREPLTGFDSDKVRALLAYLAVESDRRRPDPVAHRRESLAGMFWPERPERRARQNLSQILSNLRQVIRDQEASPPYLKATHHTLQFNVASDHSLDVGAFREHLDACEGHQHPRLAACDPCVEHLERAVDAYQGAFLEGFSLPDSPTFEEWALLEREHLLRLALEALHRLARCYEQRGQFEEGVRHAKRAVELDPLRESAHRQLMRLLALSGQRGAAIAQYDACCRTLADELGVEPEVETRALYTRIRDGEMVVAAGEEAEREPAAPGEAPYKGLQFFDVADADLFYGREALTARLVGRLREGERFLAVVGASGSGKSSLVRAGLVSALQRGEPLADGTRPPRGSERWPVRIITPTAHPLEALAVSLTRDQESVTAVTTLTDDMERDSRSLRVHVRRLLSGREGGRDRLLLVVDQFEEVFTLCRDPQERQAFIDNLLLAAEGAGGQTVVVVALRADFYHHCAQNESLREALERQQSYIGPMTAEELRRAIERPAQDHEWSFEAGLVDLLLRDVGVTEGCPPEPGALPLLSHALLETWKRRRGYTLTLGGYAEAGGVRGAIAKTAEAVYQGLSPDQQALARNVFLRLTELGEGTQDTRRRATLDELVPDAQYRAAVEVVLRILADARLIATQRNTVEVAHEALIREWPTLREWLEEDREGLRVHRHLTEAAVEWERLERDPAELYRGARLVRTTEWVEAHDDVLNPLERAFLAASEAEREARRQAEREQQAHEAALERRSRTFLRALVAVFGVAAVIALALTWFAFTQRGEALQKTQEALEAFSLSLAVHAKRALSDKDAATGLVLALAANRLDQPPAKALQTLRETAYAPGPRRRYAVTSTFPGVQGRVYSLAASPIERRFLVGFEDGTLALWDLETESEVHRLVGHAGLVRTVAFSPDGKRALSGGNDRTVVLWDLETRREIRRLQGHAGWVRAVAFHPDGRTAVSGGFVGDAVNDVVHPGELILWDLETGQEIRRYGGESGGHPSGVQAAAFTPDGRKILVSSGVFTNVNVEYSLILWDVETGERVRSFEVEHDSFSIAISPDGRTALTGSDDQKVYLWSLETGETIQTLEGHQSLVTTVAFTPDGRRAISGDWDGRLIVWDLQTGAQILQAKVHHADSQWSSTDEPAVNVATGPQGRMALSSSGDGTLIVWDLFDAGEIRRFEGHSSAAMAVAFTPDGRHALTGGGHFMGYGSLTEDNRLRLWDVETGELLRIFEGHTGAVMQVAISSDGRRALSGSMDGSMRLWDLESGAEIRSFRGYADGVGLFSVALSPDGRTGLSGSMTFDGMILWDLESGEMIHRFVSGSNFTTLAYNPGGRTAYSGGPLILWNLETGQEIRRFSDADCCTGFAIRPDGRTAFTSGSMIVREWDLENDREIRVFGEHKGNRTRMVLHPDGRTMLSSGAEGTLILWDLETGQEIRRFASYENGFILDIAVSPDGRTALVPGMNGAVILWRLDLPISPDEVREWIAANRYVRELTCEERETYSIEPLCEE